MLYIALMAQQNNPALKTSDAFTERALPLLELARNTCVGPLFSDVTAAGLSRGNAYKPGPAGPCSPRSPPRSPMRPSNCRIRCSSAPGRKQDVAPSSQLALAKDACAAGTVVEAHLYAGLSHSPTVNASLKKSLPFVRKVLAGEQITPICEPKAE